MNATNLKTIGGRMLLVALLAAVMEPTAYGRPWEPIEATFDFDQAAYRNGALVLPNFGLVETEAGDRSQVTKTGGRMGAILGWHLSPRFSLNGEMNLTLLRFKAEATDGEAYSGLSFDYGLSPLFHIGARNLEVVAGPKLGRFRYSAPDDFYGDHPVSQSSGWTYGANFGVLAPVQTMAIGGLLSYTAGHATEICDPTCHSRTSAIGDLRLISLSFAMLY